MVAVIERGEPSPQRPTLLFVHGALHGAWSWDEHFLSYFAEAGWHCVALDLRGHGDTPSARSVTWVSISDFVADVASVAATLDQPPIVIGHSLGGFVAQRYAETHPVAGLVLVGSMPPTGSWRLTLRAARHSPLATLRVFATFKLLPLFGASDAARYWFFSDAMSDEAVAGYVARLQEESFRAVLDTLVRPVRTQRISAPVMVVTGGEDRTSTPADQRIAARRYGVEPTILPGLPHDLMLDPGWEAAAAAIAQFCGGLVAQPAA